MRASRFATARQVFEAFPPARHDITAQPADSDVLAFIDQLLKGPTPEDAVSFCAYVLPRREAVWWACNCLRQLSGTLSDGDKNLLGITESWVRVPEEANRSEAIMAANAAPTKTAATWAAYAAGWSGGSLVEAPNPPVPPPSYLTAQAVRVSVLVALAAAAPKLRAANLATTVQNAVDLLKKDNFKG